MLILASQSAARTALLLGAGLRFELSPAPIDERAIEAAALGKRDGPEAVAGILAEAKAIAVSARRPDAVVIGADQVLAFEGRMLHKPADYDAVVRQLTLLRGKIHKLHAGLALAGGYFTILGLLLLPLLAALRLHAPETLDPAS